jgi:TetR/AcrR family transcriptional regulator
MREIPPQIAERLSAAAELFAERGLNDTKIEEIAAATGIAKATLYYYFAGKEDILAFLLEDGLRDAQRLGAVISAQLRVMAQRPAVCRALIGELGRAARIPVIADMISTAYLKPVENLLIAGASDGSLVTQHDPRSAAIALFGAVTTSAITYLVTDNTLDEALVARTIQSILLEGLRPR